MPGLDGFPLAHLAIAVESLAAAVPAYVALGFNVGEPEELAREKIRARIAEKDGFRIELLEPLAPGEGPIGKFIAQRGPGLHHVALRTTDLAGDLQRLAATGVVPLKGYPAAGLHGTRVAFLDPKTTGGVLYELVQG